MLRDYAASLTKTVNDFSKTNLIVASDFKTDNRTDKIGVIEAKITFIHNSQLFLVEYVDVRFP